MKRAMVFVLLLAVAAPAWGLVKNGDYIVKGHGAKSCGTWTELRKKNDYSDLYMKVWMAGFISGYNRYVPGVRAHP